MPAPIEQPAGLTPVPHEPQTETASLGMRPLRPALLTALVAHLTQRHAVGAPAIVLARPGSGTSHLLRVDLALAIAHGALASPGDDTAWTLRLLSGNPDSALNALTEAADTPTASVPDELGKPSHRPREVLVVDHLDELLALCTPSERDVLAAVLMSCATRPDRAVVCALSDNGFADAFAVPPLAPILTDRPLVVPPMTDDEVSRVVREQARECGVDVDEDVVSLAVAELRAALTSGIRALPLLTLAVRRAADEARGTSSRRIRVAHYQAVGGVAHVVERADQQALRTLDDPAQKVLRRLLLRLVHQRDTCAEDPYGLSTPATLVRSAVPLDTLDTTGSTLAASLVAAGLLVREDWPTGPILRFEVRVAVDGLATVT